MRIILQLYNRDTSDNVEDILQERAARFEQNVYDLRVVTATPYWDT